MDEVRDMVEERIALIRETSRDNLLSPSWLEHELLPRLGLNEDAREYLPPALGPYCGDGLQSFQSPNQFSKYLVHLAGRRVSSYLEIGAHFGGTFIITVEYLTRVAGAPVTGLAIDQAIFPMIHAYRELNDNVNFLQARSDHPDAARIVRCRFWDLALIDADHSEEGCQRDYALVRDDARMVAFHDIYNDVTPGVEIVWNRVRDVVPRRFVWEFKEQYVEMIRTRDQRLFGLGIVEFGR